MSRRVVRRWVVACLALAAISMSTIRADGPAVVQSPTPTPGAPVYPNFLVELGRGFVDGMEPRSDTKNDTINQNKDKVHTVGTQTTRTWTRPVFIESASNGRVDLVLSGITNAQTNSTRGRVKLGNSIQISYASHISLIVDENGVRECPAETAPNLDMNHLNYLNADFPFPVRPLVKRIAYRAYSKQLPKLNADLAKDAGKQLSEEFFKTAGGDVKHLNERYAKDIREPLQEKGVWPQRIRVMSSDRQLGIRALLNDPTGKPMNIAPVPDVHGWPDVAVRVEESLLNNFSHAMFAGKTFTGEELDDEFDRLIGPLIGKVKTSEPGDKPFTITFAKQKPIEFHFKSQSFTVTLRGEEYTSGGRDFEGMDTTAVYKLRKTNVGLIAERVGDLVIYPPGFVPGKDRLGAREKVLQQLLDRKFSKVFKPVFEQEELKLPEALNTTDVLVTTQVTSDQGWLTLGFRRAPAPPEAPAKLPVPPVKAK